MKEIHIQEKDLNIILKKSGDQTDNEIILEGIKALVKAYDIHSFPKGERGDREDEFYVSVFKFLAEKLYDELEYIGVDEKDDIPMWPIFHSLYKNLESRGLLK